jgi:predicted PurR-regulated permease PerM
MSTSVRISYAAITALLILAAWLNLGVLVLTILFGYFALQSFSFKGNRIVGVSLYIIAVAAIGWGLFYFSRQAYIALPRIAETTIPAVVGYAEKKGVELPFSDYASLKSVALKQVQEEVAGVGRYARLAFFKIALLVIGLVIALSLFLKPGWGADARQGQTPENLYTTLVHELGARFKGFYLSFAKVMGAQLIISAVNTVLTAVFLIWNGFPYVPVIIGLTFLCGLLPIIGNILSNTLIVAVGFTISPKTAWFALLFLVLIHKLEYFLNSKIIGSRIKNPMWLMLIGIVLGEKLMGITGMVLAPVVLHYIKVEASSRKMSLQTDL